MSLRPSRLDAYGRLAIVQLARFFSRWWFFLSGLAFAVILHITPESSFSSFPVVCPFRLLTGHPCPGCGTVHTLEALARLDPATAFTIHPFVATLAIAAASALPVRLLITLVPVAGRYERLSGLWTRARGVGLIPYLFAAAWLAWWLVGVARS
ncbi:MAG TPA: DUF2752 domain-containing protein [Myxococcota bacterium]|nr:DUF2752 domain-containing protein [Myxococcota bacterium]HNZ02573.1 DUF2752 domain-containing protein [Myxococcota bacterium]HOD07763.1 DUF2752 domain-containing protein [Myxococcota bacterium]